MTTKEIYINTEYITLGQFLKFAGLIANGAEAKTYLETHQVLVNEQTENRRGRKLYDQMTIQCDNNLFVIRREQ